MNVKLPLVLLLLLWASPIFGQSTVVTDTRLALLEQTQQQQDQHLQYQDKQIEQIRDQFSEIKSELAQIRGVGMGLGAILGIAQLFSIVIGLKDKRKP